MKEVEAFGCGTSGTTRKKRTVAFKLEVAGPRRFISVDRTEVSTPDSVARNKWSCLLTVSVRSDKNKKEKIGDMWQQKQMLLSCVHSVVLKLKQNKNIPEIMLLQCRQSVSISCCMFVENVLKHAATKGNRMFLFVAPVKT
ncbi:hypothetical protein V1478_000279 [Vespula squamosa]|uniref:Uncharacterized protein n=1 Tax=Vespula squamosa TaxID=30214 RepID=A0ABD2C526_VESSQ